MYICLLLLNFPNTCIFLFAGDYPKCVKQAMSHALLMLITSTEIISKNRIMEYIVTNSTFLESIFWLLSQTETRIEFGYDCLIIMALLVNFEKDRPNACAVRLSLIDDHLTLNGYSQVFTFPLYNENVSFVLWINRVIRDFDFQAITAGLSEFCLQHNPLFENSSGWLHSFTSMVGSLGNMFVTDENYKNESIWYLYQLFIVKCLFCEGRLQVY